MRPDGGTVAVPIVNFAILLILQLVVAMEKCYPVLPSDYTYSCHFYASVAYQPSLVEPSFWYFFGKMQWAGEPKYSWQDQMSMICRRSVAKKKYIYISRRPIRTTWTDFLKGVLYIPRFIVLGRVDYPSPALARILISVLQLRCSVYIVYPAVLSCSNLKLHQTLEAANIF